MTVNLDDIGDRALEENEQVGAIVVVNEDGEVEKYLNSFPKGYRFEPTDKELVKHYLSNRASGRALPTNKIKDVVFYHFHPEELAGTIFYALFYYFFLFFFPIILSSKYRPYGKKENRMWYFFTPRDRKYKNGIRPNRAAGGGYWKATGADKVIQGKNGTIIGYKKALVYYRGRPPTGQKTNWIMHEYREDEKPSVDPTASGMKLDDCVLCRIYEKQEGTNLNPKRRSRKHRASSAPRAQSAPSKPPAERIEPKLLELDQTLPNNIDAVKLNMTKELINVSDIDAANLRMDTGIIDRTNDQAMGYYIPDSVAMYNNLTPAGAAYISRNRNLMMNDGTNYTADGYLYNHLYDTANMGETITNLQQPCPMYTSLPQPCPRTNFGPIQPPGTVRYTSLQNLCESKQESCSSHLQLDDDNDGTFDGLPSLDEPQTYNSLHYSSYPKQWFKGNVDDNI
ncbi:hypothetical protein GIB67_017532 [Kingdonia uniflora]|uniref:NAC domain-containing protein n=1 Tax=Kingdonia uniflora TaxID=39325 RepID=A0A7J7M4J0_9MAGN|nr:hypothetical protein GIB67_017532 [Kingdonia uniflora]